VPLTSQQDALRFPGTVLVETDADNGLRRVSVGLVFQLTAVDKRFVAERLSRVSDTVLRSLFDALDELTDRQHLP
jgi:mRNA-degrading endonuclease toxin of MazEF toxin-antitoxin module